MAITFADNLVFFCFNRACKIFSYLSTKCNYANNHFSLIIFCSKSDSDIVSGCFKFQKVDLEAN
jgi:hypothetical protein